MISASNQSTIEAFNRNADRHTEEPGFLTGALSAPFMGIAGAASEIGNTADVLIGMPMAIGFGKLTGENPDEYFNYLQRQNELEKPLYTLDPAENGIAANVLHGATKILGEAAIGASMGGLPGAMALTGLAGAGGTTIENIDKGVGIETSLQQGLIEGETRALGVAMPAAIGSTLTQRLASGVIGNVGMGLAERELAKQSYEAGGYQDLADQQQPIDATGIAIDALLGLGFAGIHHMSMGIKPSDIDAARAVNNAQHIVDMAPVDKADPAAMTEYSDQMTQAINELSSDNPVTAYIDSSRISSDSMAEWEATIADYSNKLTKGDRIGVEQQIRDLEYKLSNIDLSTKQDFIDQVRRDNPRMPARKQASLAEEMASNSNDEYRKSIEEPLARLRNQLEIDEKARIANRDLVNEFVTPETRTELINRPLEQMAVKANEDRLNTEALPKTKEQVAQKEPTQTNLDQETRLAYDMLKENPDIPYHVINSDESVSTLKASEVLAQADAEVKYSEELQPSFMAAVQCFLRHGA